MVEGDTKSSKNKQDGFEFLLKNEGPTRTDFLKNIAKNLAKIRQEKAWTQDKLNYRLGVADRLVNKWECGDKTPSGFNLYCWADALGEILSSMPQKTVKAVFHLSDGSVIEREFEANKEDIQ